MDTLARAKKLETLGFDRTKAEGLVQMVKQSIDEEVAKKADLRELRADLKSDVSEVRLEIGQVKSELKQDIADLRTELKQDIFEVRLEIVQVKSELKQDIADMKIDIGTMKGEIGAMKGEIGEMKGEFKTLHAKIDSLGTDLVKKLGGLILVLWGLGLEWGKGNSLMAMLIESITGAFK